MEWLKWLAGTGTNELVAGIVDKNSFLLVPLATTAYYFLRGYVKSTKATWDDKALGALFDHFGLKTEPVTDAEPIEPK